LDHQAVLEHILEWAEINPNVRASVLTGSLARDPAASDAESDLDVELYVADPSLLLQEDNWYQQFGEVLVVEALENPGWHPTRLVYYVDGKIDFMIASTTVLEDTVEYDRPFRILIDKDGVARAFQHKARVEGQPPPSAEFFECIHWFYAATIMWAKYLARDDPWAARQRDWDSKQLLLMMLEWDHKARKGWDYETWYLGVHLRQWVDAELLGPIDACWSGFSRQDSVRALWASLSLFDVLSTRTASALGIAPFDATRVRSRIDHLLRAIA
jgi:aminoglycoside 6-adenylyltransferase